MLSVSQILSLQNEMIIDIIREWSKNNDPSPPSSSVDCLVSLFSTMERVTFVYVKHSIISGFVTYTKVHSEERNDMSSSSLTHNVHAWMKALKIGDDE